MEKNNFRFFGFIALIVFAISFVSATTAMNVPETNNNYTTITFNCTTDETDCLNCLNATIWYNVSGGIVNTTLGAIENGSANDVDFTGSLSIEDLGDALTYNFTCAMWNATGNVINSSAVENVGIDNTVPELAYTTGTPTTNTGADRAWIFVNITATDMTNDTITFALYNSSGLVNSTNYTDSYGNTTINWTGLTNNKVYYFNVTANDSATNSVSLATITFYLDGTTPTLVTLAESSSTQTTLTISISANDALSGFASSSCTATSRSGASISGSGASQTLIESGLSCGTSYSYTVTCSDRAGNSKASSSTSFSTDACSGGGTTTTTTTTWTNTYRLTEEQAEEGFTQELSAKHRVKISVGGADHHIGIKSLTATSATIEIASDPVEVTLEVGEDAKVDVTDDGFYDVYVILNSIADNKADVTIKSIYEEVPEGAEGVETTGEVTGEEDAAGGEEEEERNLTWLWILIGVVVLAVIIGGGIAAKKKQ